MNILWHDQIVQVPLTSTCPYSDASGLRVLKLTVLFIFLYLVNCESSTITRRIEDLENPAPFATFLTIPCYFRYIIFFASEIMLLMQAERVLAGISLP